MEFEKLMELENIGAQIELYVERALFINNTARGEYESNKECFSTRSIVYSGIIDDYMRMLKEKAQELDDLTELFFEEYRKQKAQETAED